MHIVHVMRCGQELEAERVALAEQERKLKSEGRGVGERAVAAAQAMQSLQQAAAAGGAGEPMATCKTFSTHTSHSVHLPAGQVGTACGGM